MSVFQYVRGGETYEQLRRDFRWQIPATFNLGAGCTDAFPREREALTHLPLHGAPQVFTFGDLSMLSNRMANCLRGLGLTTHDRVAVILPQLPETAISHFGIFKARMISVPLSSLFGPEAVQTRLTDSAAKVVITTTAGLSRFGEVLPEIESVRYVLVTDLDRDKDGKVRSFWGTLTAASDRFAVEPTPVEDPCFILYTSGTTGPPKGVLHSHRAVLAQIPSRQMTFDVFPQKGDRVWTPADWAWTGGLVGILLCTLVHGAPVVSAERSGGLDAEWALNLLQTQGITNGFIPPMVLKLMLDAPRKSGLKLRAVSCGGENMSAEVLTEISQALGGVSLCSGFGQTEADAFSGCYPSSWAIRPGSAGKPYPGHHIEIFKDDGSFAKVSETGEIALQLPNPSALIGYWNNPEATERKLGSGWLRTGDIGRIDDEGYLWFITRADEMIKTSGYRVGPSEVENCLLKHPAVAACVVVGVPDKVRGQIIKAYIQAESGIETNDDLAENIKNFVRSRLASYQYPREIAFVESFPMTTSGKIDRGAIRRRSNA